MKVGVLCGEAYNDSSQPGSNTRTQRAWLYEPDAALSNIHYGGKKHFAVESLSFETYL